MATCVKCSAAIPDDSLFCNYCGAKQELICAACGAALSTGSRFCNYCGSSVSGTEVQKAAAQPFSKEWADFMNRGKTVGNEKYHFVYYGHGKEKLYRIDPAGTVTVVPGVPYGEVTKRGECPLVWAEDKLWYGVEDDGWYCLHTLDPETLVWSLEARFKKSGYYSSDISAPYVTSDYVWFDGVSSVLVLNRKTWMDGAVKEGRVDALANDYPTIKSVGKNQICAKRADFDSDFFFLDWWGNKQGFTNKVSVILPMLPLMAELSGKSLSMEEGRENYLARVAFLDNHIQYIDFEQKLVYFTCNAEAPWAGKGYSLPFGATDPGQAKLFWAGGDGMECEAACNWQYCVGTASEGDNNKVELILRKADGTTVALGNHTLKKEYGKYTGIELVNDTVYVFRYGVLLEGRYVFRPGADKPEFQKLKLVD